MATNAHPGNLQDIETIKRLYAGINSNDIDAVIKLMDDNIIRIEPEGFPTAGTYRGLSALRQHLMTGRSTWADGGCEPVDFFAVEDKMVVAVHIKVRLKDKSDWIDAQITDGFIIKDGRIAAFHSFATHPKALEWAATPAFPING